MGCSQGSTSTTQSGPSPQVSQAYQNLTNQATNVAGQPYAAYTGPLISGFTPDQLQAFNTVQQVQGYPQGYLNQASNYIQSAAAPIDPTQFSGWQGLGSQGVQSIQNESNPIQTALGQAQNLNSGPFTQSALNSAAGANYLASNLNVSPYTGQAQNAANQAQGVANNLNVSPYTAPAMSPINLPDYNTLSTYFNPYQTSVTQATQNLFDQQNAQQLAQVRGNATSQNAYGGDREAVAEALTAQQQQLAEAPTLAGIQQQGFAQAQGELNTQQQVELARQQAQGQLGLGAGQLYTQAGLGAGQLGLGAGQLGLGAGQLYTQAGLGSGQLGLGAGQLGLGAGQLNLQTGLGAGQLGLSTAQTMGQQGQALLGEYNAQQQAGIGAQEASGWLQQGAGYGLANLGQAAQTNALTGANAQLGIGALEQQLAQEQLNIPYEMFQSQQAYPFQTTNYLGNIVEGIGSASGGQSSTTSPGPSPISQIAGLGVAGVGAYGLYNQFNGGGSGAAGSSGGDASSPYFTNSVGNVANAGGDYGSFVARGGRVNRAPGGSLGSPPAHGGVEDVSVTYIPGGGAGVGASNPNSGFSPFQPVVNTTQTSGGGGLLSGLGNLIGLGKAASSSGALDAIGALFIRDGGRIPHRAVGGSALPDSGATGASVMHPGVAPVDLELPPPAILPSHGTPITPTQSFSPVTDFSGYPIGMQSNPWGTAGSHMSIPLSNGTLARPIPPSPGGSADPNAGATSLGTPIDSSGLPLVDPFSFLVGSSGGGAARGGRIGRDDGGATTSSNLPTVPNLTLAFIPQAGQLQKRSTIPAPPHAAQQSNPLQDINQMTSGISGINKAIGGLGLGSSSDGSADGGAVTLGSYGQGYDAGGSVDQAGATMTGGMNPMQSGSYNQLSQMTPEQLQELAARAQTDPQMAGQYGQIIQRMLQMKRMNPSYGQQAQVAAPQIGSLGSTPAPTTPLAPSISGTIGGGYAHGGWLHRDDGGDIPDTGADYGGGSDDKFAISAKLPPPIPLPNSTLEHVADVHDDIVSPNLSTKAGPTPVPADLSGPVPNDPNPTGGSLGIVPLDADGRPKIPATSGPNGWEPIVPTANERGTLTPPKSSPANDFLKSQRQRMADEIKNTPGLQDKLLAIANLEDDRDPAGPLESLFNRAAYTNKSITELLGEGSQNSFYNPIRKGKLPGEVNKLNNDPALKTWLQAGLDTAINGSNRLKGATDQGTGGDPNANTKSGLIMPPGGTPSAIYNDWGGGPGGVAGAAKWRETQQQQIGEGTDSVSDDYFKSLGSRPSGTGGGNLGSTLVSHSSDVEHQQALGNMPHGDNSAAAGQGNLGVTYDSLIREAIDDLKKPGGMQAILSSPYLPIIAAGLGMMASRSPFPGVAIGEGGLAGLKAFTETQKLAGEQQKENIAMAAAKMKLANPLRMAAMMQEQDAVGGNRGSTNLSPSPSVIPIPSSAQAGANAPTDSIMPSGSAVSPAPVTAASSPQKATPAGQTEQNATPSLSPEQVKIENEIRTELQKTKIAQRYADTPEHQVALESKYKELYLSLPSVKMGLEQATRQGANAADIQKATALFPQEFWKSYAVNWSRPREIKEGTILTDPMVQAFGLPRIRSMIGGLLGLPQGAQLPGEFTASGDPVQFKDSAGPATQAPAMADEKPKQYGGFPSPSPLPVDPTLTMPAKRIVQTPEGGTTLAETRPGLAAHQAGVGKQAEENQKKIADLAQQYVPMQTQHAALMNAARDGSSRLLQTGSLIETRKMLADGVSTFAQIMGTDPNKIINQADLANLDNIEKVRFSLGTALTHAVSARPAYLEFQGALNSVPSSAKPIFTGLLLSNVLRYSNQFEAAARQYAQDQYQNRGIAPDMAFAQFTNEYGRRVAAQALASTYIDLAQVQPQRMGRDADMVNALMNMPPDKQQEAIKIFDSRFTPLVGDGTKPGSRPVTASAFGIPSWGELFLSLKPQSQTQ